MSEPDKSQSDSLSDFDFEKFISDETDNGAENEHLAENAPLAENNDAAEDGEGFDSAIFGAAFSDGAVVDHADTDPGAEMPSDFPPDMFAPVSPETDVLEPDPFGGETAPEPEPEPEPESEPIADENAADVPPAVADVPSKKGKPKKEKKPPRERKPLDITTLLCAVFAISLLASILLFSIAAFMTRQPNSSIMHTICFIGAFDIIGLVAVSVPLMFLLDIKKGKPAALPNVLLGIAAVALLCGVEILLCEFYQYGFLVKP